MHAFLGVTRYEYQMGVRRWGLWLAVTLALSPFVPFLLNVPSVLAGTSDWQQAGQIALVLNYLMPVVGGIAIADRLDRDTGLGVAEILHSTPLTRASYVWGKYVGALLAVLTPVLAVSLAVALLLVLRGAPVGLIGDLLVAFLGIQVPAYAFVAAFSLACPAVLPVRAYQVLFTGYWFWGTHLNPEFLPTLNGTILTPSGIFVASGIFGVQNYYLHTPVEALINLAVLVLLGGGVLVALDRRLAKQGWWA